jgi:serine/threonine protein kinase
MRLASPDALLQALREHQLLDPVQLDEVRRTLRLRFTAVQPFGQELVAQGLLTPYQFDELWAGRGRELVMGPYVLLGPVGEGGMGSVYQARLQSGGDIVALKVIRKDRRADPKLRQRFLREVQALTKLKHPNIVTALGADEADGAHYFVMEYIEGSNLGDILARIGALPVLPACDYARQAALGLQHAHEHGLVHRDVSPNNLLIQAWPAPEPPTLRGKDRARFGRWGTVKLFDLGLVLLQQHERDPAQEKLTRTGISLGTVDYIAPEQIMDAHHVDIRADLYSLGCTLYEMLTGQVPFTDPAPTRTLLAHQTQEPPPMENFRRDLPADVATVVKTLMAKDPNQRYATPAACAEALTECQCQADVATIAADWTPFTSALTSSPSSPGEEPRGDSAWWKRLLAWGRPRS